MTKTSPILYDLTVEAAPPPCKVVHDKTAFPKVAEVGNAVTVTLAMHAVGQCSFEGSPVDAVLVIDRSGSMGNKDGTNVRRLTHAQDAASLFVDQMQLPPDRVGVASFASRGKGTLDIGLTDDATAVKNTISGLSATGMTDMAEGLELAETELLANGQAPNVPIIIILSDGHHNESQPGELVDTAYRIKREGIRIISIGIGGANESQLKAIASSTDDYYYAPDATDLADIYKEIAPTVRVAGRNVVLTDTVSSFATLIPDTFQGPVTPTVNGDDIFWRLPGIPIKGITLTYQVAMTSTAGTWDTNNSAVATYIDSGGNDAELVFPKPKVVVPVVCPAPQIKDIEPVWACVDEAVDPVKILGSGFITLTDFTSITGTFGVDANIGAQALSIYNWTHSLINGVLPANNGLAVGMHDVVVTNTCVLSTIIPGGSSHPTPTIVPIPPEIKSVVLADGFRLYGPPRILSVRPPEGYNDIPTDLTICGEGFAPGAEVFLEVPTGTIKLSDQAVYGDTCLAGTVPADLTPGEYKIIVRGPCGEDTAMFRVLDAGLNNDLWAQPEKLWVNPSICVRECDEDISMGLIVNRRGGKEPLQNVIVRFYEGNPQDAGSVEIGDGVIPLLSPRVSPAERIGGFSTSAVTWTPSSGVMSYTLYAVIDPDNNVEEDVEENNIVSRTVQVLPCDPQFDGVAPHVDSFEIARGHDVVHDPAVDLHVTATDFAQRGIIPSGISQMYFVEYLFNKATEIWVPVGSSGWLTFSEDSTWTLYPQGGLRFIQAWASDKLANVSRYPYQQQVNYIQPCDAVSRDGTRTYRRHLKPGDTIYVEVAPCKGDPDLYIWPPDWEDGNLAWVSNLYHDATEFLSVTVTVSGVYQVEVYGYTNAYYNVNIETEPGSANMRLLASRAHFATAGESDKLQPTAPTLTPDSLPDVIMGVPPAPSGRFPDASDVNIQGPRQTWVDVSTTFTATLLPTIVAPVTYTWEATAQSAIEDMVSTGAGSTQNFSWDTPGVKTITVTASTSAGASVKSTYTTPVSTSPPRSVDVAGASEGTVDTAYIFTATIKPGTATMPVTYTWEATDQLSPTVHGGVVNYMDTMSFTWTMVSTKTITVTVDNGVDTPAVGIHHIMITQELKPTTQTSSTLTSADQDIIIDFPEPMITDTIDFTITPTVPFTWTWMYGRRAPLMGPTGATIHHDPFTPNITYTLSLLPGAKTVTGKDVVATDFFFQFEMQGYTVYLPLVLRNY